MLYLTTRDKHDTFTAHRALQENTAPDGGCYAPISFPVYESEQLASFREKSFGQNVADILNIFFSSRITGWDVDFCIGRNAIRAITMNHKMIVAELWHNPSSNYQFIVNCLYEKICGNKKAGKPSAWFSIAVRIAVLYGLYGELCGQQIIGTCEKLDISVSSYDTFAMIAVWYAREMGLPIDTIIYTCDDTHIWDLTHHGVMNLSNVDVGMIGNIERLILATLGHKEVSRFCAAVQAKSSYSINEEQLTILNKGLCCVVTGKKRSEQTINSVYRSNSIILDPNTALCVGGLQDYRAQSGASRTTIVLADASPLSYIDEVERATGVSKNKIPELITRI